MMMFKTSKLVPKTEKRCCVFKDKTAYACDKECLKPKMYLITAYSVWINKGRNGPFLSIFDDMSRRGITGAGFSC